MTITPFDLLCEKTATKSTGSTHSSKCGNSDWLTKTNFGADNNLLSATSKRSKFKKMNSRSPYLTSDRIQLLSRITEKRLVHKKTTDFVSSFPLALNIYKASSDEFKSFKKANKKVKKSVLTLPNNPAPMPQVCTVSDMNDSEYSEKNDGVRSQKKIWRRAPIQSTRNARAREQDLEFYDRDAQYYCSSTDIIKNVKGDGKSVRIRKKCSPNLNKSKASNNMSDVWAVLRNINKFQFRPSPPGSDDSTMVRKRKLKSPRKANHKTKRVIETCTTEEFAYIQSYELDENAPRSLSRSSSTDRVTVIGNKNDFSKMCKEFEKRLLKTSDFLNDSNSTKNRKQKNKIPKSNVRTGNAKDKQQILLKKKKKPNIKPTVNQQRSGDPHMNENTDPLIDTESIIPSNLTEIDCVYVAKTNFSCSPRSSKSELHNKTNDQTIKDISAYVSKTQLNEVSKVVFSKEQELTINPVTPEQLDPLKRKTRLVTTMPSSFIMPKSTKADIRRRLANIRFPITVLGKDQVSSSITVMDYDPPQFDGLEDHIWPFMIGWTLDGIKETKNHSDNLGRKCQSFLSDNSNKLRRPYTEVGAYKRTTLRDKKVIDDFITNKKKPELKRPTTFSEIAAKPLQCSKKQKSIVQLKEKMLNFLYKKSSSNIVENNYQDEVKPNSARLTGIPQPDSNGLMHTDVPRKRAFLNPFPIVSRNKRNQNFTYPWAKAKWASDFIENVIRKIRSGVYYSQDLMDVCHKYQFDLKEVSVQAGSLSEACNYTQTYGSNTDLALKEIIKTNRNNNTCLPGFNNTLPLLEIKTLNTNQIIVKHRKTNVVVQFDVSVPTKTDHRTTSMTKISPLIPIEVTASHTKIYKCRTAILNAMLPAEICSILPKMMTNIIDANKNLDRSLCSAKLDPSLSPITELTRHETCGSINLNIRKSSHVALAPVVKIIHGRFTNQVHNKSRNKVDVRIDFDPCLVTEMLPKVLLDDFWKYEVNPLLVEIDSLKYTNSQVLLHQSNKPISGIPDKNLTCTSMQLYTSSNKRLMMRNFDHCNILGVVESILRNHNSQIYLNLSSYFDMVKLHNSGKNIKINMSMTSDSGIQKNLTVTISNLKADSLYKYLPKPQTEKNDIPNESNTNLKCIEYINTSLASNPESIVAKQFVVNKTKRRGFVKLYRKCKSTTNIPSGEKCTNLPPVEKYHNTQINKITTLEDFFQILGYRKVFLNVFDGYPAKKILSSIAEMKNWITEITPKQALLILLLTNKKDTQNLVRFRPLILQGIAVNRITRATELDMEIEVIERENFNKLSQQCEGISYLPNSVTNYDNLMEELYWIAKTTASDYHKTFDESSERLLKSLLEKRKKLNPSYLRVMARYVGLGLLKPPTK